MESNLSNCCLQSPSIENLKKMNDNYVTDTHNLASPSICNIVQHSALQKAR